MLACRDSFLVDALNDMKDGPALAGVKSEYRLGKDGESAKHEAIFIFIR